MLTLLKCPIEEATADEEEEEVSGAGATEVAVAVAFEAGAQVVAGTGADFVEAGPRAVGIAAVEDREVDSEDGEEVHLAGELRVKRLLSSSTNNERPLTSAALAAYSVFRPDNNPVNLDARLQDNSLDNLVSTLGRLTLTEGELPHRAGFGTIGTSIKLRTNFYAVKLPKGAFYEYDVSITPELKTAARRLKKRIFQLLEDTPEFRPHMGYLAHDASTKIISARRLPESLTATFPYFDEDEDGPPAQNLKTYTATVKFVKELNTEDILKCAFPLTDERRRRIDLFVTDSCLESLNTEVTIQCRSSLHATSCSLNTPIAAEYPSGEISSSSHRWASSISEEASRPSRASTAPFDQLTSS